MSHDYEQARSGFTFPDVGEVFNWAHDWFDVVADGQDRPALILVEQDGSQQSVTFDEMRRRSNRLAAWLRGQGVGVGSRVLLMLGNQVELWETMLAVIKLGGALMPTTTAVGTADLIDRVGRGGATVAICNPADTAKFADVPGDYTPITLGQVDGWLDYRDSAGGSDEALPHPGTKATDTLLLYFTSGTTSQPKLVEHTQVSYPVGHLHRARR